MAAGLEVVTPDGHLQLTTDLLYFRFEGKTTLNNTGWSQWGTTGSYRDVTFNGPGANDAPMLALSCTAGVWATRIAATTTSVTFRVYRVSAGGASVTCYLFSRRPPPDANAPFVLFNSAGNCVFNANYPPARPIGIYKDEVYTGLSRSGRDCAFVPQKRRTYRFNVFTKGGAGSCNPGGGLTGYQQYITTGWSETAIVCNGSTLSLTSIGSSVGPTPHSCTTTAVVPAANTGESPGYSCLILDVTNY